MKFLSERERIFTQSEKLVRNEKNLYMNVITDQAFLKAELNISMIVILPDSTKKKDFLKKLEALVDEYKS